jgi:hypothetical protein
MGEERKVYKVWVGKSEGKRPLVRPRLRWEDGIRMDIGGCGLDSTGSGQGPVAGCCECGDEPSGSCSTELRVNADQRFRKCDTGTDFKRYAAENISLKMFWSSICCHMNTNMKKIEQIHFLYWLYQETAQSAVTDSDIG